MDNTSTPASHPHRLHLLLLPLVALFTVFAVLGVKSSRTATLDLLFTPASAEATLNGESVSAGKISLSPGEHTLKLEMYGFAPIEETFTLSSGSSAPAYYILTSSESFTQNWYTEHPSDALLAEGISSRLFDAASADASAARASYPALKHLPVKRKTFSIYASTCSSPSPCIIISSNSASRDSALAFFRDNLDSNLGRYVFTFKDYTNPFRGEG